MARRGVSNYCHSCDGPVISDRVWKETMEHERKPHTYSTLNQPVLAQRSSYATMTTESKDVYGKTWRSFYHTRSYAAGKSSYHHNVCKPLGGQSKAHTASHTFERLPAASRTLGASDVLRGSASMGSLRMGKTLHPSFDLEFY
mmetsp:Transcript_62368/g.115770  ORF Transcript_62368/g.115770 Transcript_62368/m.115770 type:complete len:143 (-) Transcript_62368:63-491(-)